MKIKVFTVLIISLLVLSACFGGGAPVPPGDNPDDPNDNPDPGDTQEPPLEEPFDFAKYQPNELGEIPFFMYHHIAEPEAEWSRTPDNFRADLQRFYDAGFRLVSVTDVINDNISIPAGTSPLVLTFDDGNANNFRLIKNAAGEIVLDPDCAVAILLDFAERYPDMGTAATFYINANPFNQRADAWYTTQHRDWKLNKLVEWGMEIGNHTWNHPHLSRDIKSAENLQEQMARVQQFVAGIVPGYQLSSLALPFGSKPIDEWKQFVNQGQWNGVSYKHGIVLLVGSTPGNPPNHAKYSPLAMPRVRASNWKLNDRDHSFLDRALQRLEKSRYISDGDPNTITIPQNMEQHLDRRQLGDKQVRIYNAEFEEIGN